MTSQQSETVSESSLPTHQAQHFASSPPILQLSFQKPGEMEKSPHFKSEPPAVAQNNDASKPAMRRVNSGETERPPSAQRVQREDTIPDSEDSDEDELDTDPAERIVDFNWDELHQRYHEAMSGCHAQEAELAQEWESLMNYFRVWAESGHEHETDRTFQRLKTRTTYVQNSEASLENRRNHYINVVKAFESALSLLKATSFSR